MRTSSSNSHLPLAQVKAFNLRYRSKHFAGDPTVINVYDDGSLPSDSSVDPRGSAAFIELDHLVSSFRASFPGHLRNPINDNVVDNHLYTACLMPHVYVSIKYNYFKGSDYSTLGLLLYYTTLMPKSANRVVSRPSRF